MRKLNKPKTELQVPKIFTSFQLKEAKHKALHVATVERAKSKLNQTENMCFSTGASIAMSALFGALGIRSDKDLYELDEAAESLREYDQEAQ